MNARQMQAKSAAVKQAKAIKRREKVSELKESGMTGAEIADKLDIKLRTVYHDFTILKRETRS